MNNEAKPCRNCGVDTRQRVNGVAYCSADCVGGRRREQNFETIDCPYPDCKWDTDYRPDNGLSRTKTYREAEEHREMHRTELESERGETA